LKNLNSENKAVQNKQVSVWILGDQLLARHPALDPARQSELIVVIIEATNRFTKYAYHKKKIALVLSAMRHYAADLREAGWQVDYRQALTFQAGLKAHLQENRSKRLIMMAAAEYPARQSQQNLENSLLEAKIQVEVEILPNTQFLAGQFTPAEKPGKKLIMEYFYRAMRQHFGLLIEPNGKPTGGDWNYDALNRKPYDGKVKPPALPAFAPDDITQAVLSEVEQAAPKNVGSTAGFDLPVTRAQALASLQDFIEHRLAYFGPYEDAMSQNEPVLFHSLLSPLLNIGLLEPLEVVQAAEIAYRTGKVPLPSVEGFVRQIIGWREYIYWHYHRDMPDFRKLNSWEAHASLPGFYWNGQTEMNCLRTVITKLLDTGYTHHIERLMVLSNFGLLAGIEPEEVNDWFLSCYFDAYDWVVTPNVIGMGLCADGGQVGTKPYAASGAYINRMSDYCKGCRYSPKIRSGPQACPYNFLYWNFLLKHEARLKANPRMGPAVLGLRHIKPDEREIIQRQATTFITQLESAY